MPQTVQLASLSSVFDPYDTLAGCPDSLINQQCLVGHDKKQMEMSAQDVPMWGR